MSNSEAEQRAHEDALVAKANEVRKLWKTLATAFDFPQEEPPRNKCHWDFVLQEQAWLATDMMQERLWKEAAAYQLAHEAKGFLRSSLKHTQTVETGICPGLGKVKVDGKPDLPDHVGKSEALANGKAVGKEGSTAMEEDSEVESVTIGPLVFTCTPEFIQSVAEHLEEEDVRRLASHADAQSAYQVAWDTARRIQPPHFVIDEDDLPLGRRKRKFKPGSLVMPGGDEDAYELGASPLAGKPPRPIAGSMRPIPGRIEDDKRKRKQARGEYGDEEFDPKAMQRAGSMRPGMGSMRADSRSDVMMGAGMDKKGLGVQKAAGVKTPPGKGSLQRIDPMGRPQGVQRGAAWGGRGQGMVQGNWSQQDDQLLVAIVTEFNQNWHLVADVLRSASSMSGVYRKFDVCKQRYMQLLKQYQQQMDPDGAEVRPEILANQPIMSKQQAKDVISTHLPVPDMVLAQHQRCVAELSGRLRQKRLAERATARETHRYRQPDHQSHTRIQQSVMATTGNRVLSPLDVGVVPMDAPFHQYRTAQTAIAQAVVAAAQHKQGSGQPGAGGAAGQREAAAAAAAAQAQEAAAAAAAAVSQQQGGHGGQQGGGSLTGGSTGAGGPPSAKPGAPGAPGPAKQQLPPGLTKEMLLQRATTTPIPQLQEQLRQAQAAVQQNPSNPELKVALSQAQAVLSAANTIRQAKEQRAAQAAAAAAGGQPGAAAAATGAPGAPRPQGMNLSQQLQQAVASGRISAPMAKQIVHAVQTNSMTPQHMAILQQLKAQSQAAQAAGMAPGGMPGARPNAGVPPVAPGMTPGQMQGMQPPGQPGMWNNAANMQAAAAAAAAAQQAAQQAAEQARNKPK